MKKENIKQLVDGILEQVEERDFITLDQLFNTNFTSGRIHVRSIAANLPPNLKIAKLMRRNQWIILVKEKEKEIRRQFPDEVFYEYKKSKRSKMSTAIKSSNITATAGHSSITILETVVKGIAPLLIDVSESVKIEKLVSRLGCLKPLLESLRISGEKDELKHLLSTWYSARPDVFRSIKTLEGEEMITVNDFIGLQMLRLSPIDSGLYNLHLVTKGSHPLSKDIAKTLSRFLSNFNILGEDRKYIARAMALGRLDPSWAFRDSKSEIQKMNDYIKLYGMLFVMDEVTGNVVLKSYKPHRVQSLINIIRRFL